jgi:Uma2 family endonuclease
MKNVAKPAKRTATYEDLLQVPEHLVAELIDGELYTSPRPASRHARAAGAIYSRLSRLFDEGDDGPGGWWIVFEPELHLGGDALVPDVAGWRRERVPEFPDVVVWTIAPDWVCEVLSPGTAKLDRLLKLPKYAREGVEYAWIAEPMTRTIEVHQLIDGRMELVAVHTGDGAERIAPFDAVEIPLDRLWLPMRRA